MALGYRTLSRKSHQRKALFRDLITDLILNGRIETTVSKEKELRQELLNKKGLVLEDKIMRSLGTLQNARIMQSKEMMSLLSDVRLGISLGLIKDISIKKITSLMIMASRAHISSSETSDAPFERDVERAKLIRNTL